MMITIEVAERPCSFFSVEFFNFNSKIYLNKTPSIIEGANKTKLFMKINFELKAKGRKNQNMY